MVRIGDNVEFGYEHIYFDRKTGHTWAKWEITTGTVLSIENGWAKLAYQQRGTGGTFLAEYRVHDIETRDLTEKPRYLYDED